MFFITKTNVYTCYHFQEFEVTLPQKGSKKGAVRGCPKKSKLVPTMVSNVAQSPVTSQTVLPIVGSAVSPANAIGSPASPLVSTQATTNTTPVTVLPGSTMSTMNKVRSRRSSQLVDSLFFLPYPTIIFSVMIYTCIPPPLQARRGVKRQADTTTPSSGQPSPSSATPAVPQPLIPQRRESTRQVKRPKMDLPGETTYPVSVSGCVCMREKGMLSACGMVVLTPTRGVK